MVRLPASVLDSEGSWFEQTMIAARIFCLKLIAKLEPLSCHVRERPRAILINKTKVGQALMSTRVDKLED